jgi:hypothetical protein
MSGRGPVPGGVYVLSFLIQEHSLLPIPLVQVFTKAVRRLIRIAL